MDVPLPQLSDALKTIHDIDPGPYDVTFHLSEEGVVEKLYLVRRDAGPSTPEARALKAEMTLRRIAMILLQARVLKDFEMVHELITNAHNEWVDDKVDVG